MQQHVIETADPRALGRRLQEARKARGLTQQEVAEALSVARTTITAMEKGERRPRPGEIIQMARLYGHAVGDFVGQREPATDFTVQFRITSSRTTSTNDQMELDDGVREFRSLCEDYLYLETLTGASLRRSYPLQYSIGGIAPEHAAEDVASSERNRLALGDGPLLHLQETLENDVGLRIFSIELPSRVAGIFSYSEELGGCIAVNARHPEERQRLSIAHEYGHFLTQRFQPEVSMLGAYSRVPAAERFADAFACSLLMPAVGLRRRFNDLSRATDGRVTMADVCRLAHQYFVSVEAMTLRLEEFRLLPRGTWERLRDRGFRVREAQAQLGLASRSPGNSLLPLRYQLLAVRAYEEGELTEGELARLLRVDRVLARRVAQSLTHPAHLLSEGEVGALSIDLASSLSEQPS